MKYIEVEQKVNARRIEFRDKDRNDIAPLTLYTNIFAEHPTKELEIEEGYTLVGYAVAVDKDGDPSWLDFVVAGGEQ